MRGIVALVCALVLNAASTAPTRAQVLQGSTAKPVSVDNVAGKLGVKLAPGSGLELDIGKSVTGTLEDPARIEKFGIKGMHEGARVTITCVAPNRIRVEADEMEPVEHDVVVTLQVSSDGGLSVAPAPPKPAPKPPI